MPNCKRIFFIRLFFGISVFLIFYKLVFSRRSRQNTEREGRDPRQQKNKIKNQITPFPVLTRMTKKSR